jgi:hypothetical protein
MLEPTNAPVDPLIIWPRNADEVAQPRWKFPPMSAHAECHGTLPDVTTLVESVRIDPIITPNCVNVAHFIVALVCQISEKFPPISGRTSGNVVHVSVAMLNGGQSSEPFAAWMRKPTPIDPRQWIGVMKYPHGNRTG